MRPFAPGSFESTSSLGFRGVPTQTSVGGLIRPRNAAASQILDKNGERRSQQMASKYKKTGELILRPTHLVLLARLFRQPGKTVPSKRAWAGIDSSYLTAINSLPQGTVKVTRRGSAWQFTLDREGEDALLGRIPVWVFGQGLYRGPDSDLAAIAAEESAARKQHAVEEAKPIMASHLTSLGVYGFDAVEPIILAALVTEDPLILIGSSGTGKTFLLNSVSEALGLEHRHYNASLISFDDLVGFPYPDKDNSSVKFLETPATIWAAESVLIDEISRCKPEHQNRLFSLIHERRVQGISLPKLRYRWAAMNPSSADQPAIEEYAGSEPLDPALADRFALFVWAVDWNGLSAGEKAMVADPGGEGRISSDAGCLLEQVNGWRRKFLDEVDHCPRLILDYVTLAVTHLNNGGIRISPRRARLIARSLLAATIVVEGTRVVVPEGPGMQPSTRDLRCDAETGDYCSRSSCRLGCCEPDGWCLDSRIPRGTVPGWQTNPLAGEVRATGCR